MLLPMKRTYKITGTEALRLAERDNLTLHCHANPIDDGGVITIEQGRAIAKEDASLLYIQVVPTGWTGDATGYQVCDYFRLIGDEHNDGTRYNGPDDDGIEPTWADAPQGQ